MRRAFILAIIIFPSFILPLAAGNRVSVEAAGTVAVNWLFERSDFSRSGLTVREVFEERDQEIPVYYVFNLSPDGFVIVAADDAAHPILGYSGSGRYSPFSHFPAFDELMNHRREEITSLSKSRVPAAADTQKMWQKYQVDPRVFALQAPRPSIEAPRPSFAAVSPLLSTTWHQGPYYNDLCPANDCGGPGGHAWAGCIATAMAQVMKKWNYPATGTGSWSYTPSGYPEQSVDFGATSYDWAAMPNSLSSANSAVATLIYHAGVATSMQYGLCGTDSKTYTASARAALQNYFRYSRSALRVNEPDYSSASWDTLLKTELDASRPVLYEGCNSARSLCHVWVLDGYEFTTSYYYHVNWGWGGGYDGYFYLSDLTPGSYNFNYSHDAIVQIIPADQMPEPNLQSVTVPASITLGNYIELNLTSENTGQPADDSYITASFPGFTNASDGQYVTVHEQSPGTSFATKAAGTTVLTKEGIPVTATYLIAEMAHPSWGTDQKSIVLRVYPQQTGTFEFYVRSTMGKQGAYVNSPISSGDLDQQTWQVTSYSVLVTSGPAVPGAFAKTSPASGATGQAAGLTLSWGASSGATSYDYCVNTAANCSEWTSAGTGTSVSPAGLLPGTSYYWQVRAVNGGGTTEADSGTWWSFTTAPGAFSKTSPAHGATGQSASLTLSWGGSSGAASYEYCVNTSAGCTTWTSAGASTNASVAGLINGSTYYWQVRAIKSGGITEANSGTWWSFTTNPFDIDGNGSVDVVDLQTLVNVILMVVTCPGNCNLDGQDGVNVLDLQILINMILSP